MEGFCRSCLKKYNDPAELLQYCEGNRRMFIYSTGIQVKRNDSFTFQLCKECFTNMKLSCKFKKMCRSSDKKFKNYLSLKEYEGSMDFSTYLRNTENTLTLKLPTASASNTPAHQKNRDDDNDSTCTSIRNFMTNILQDEEMAPTEAQIIREVIQEEADISDDSLDSHWMQDDMSVVSEFEDFNFSTFSTPAHSINTPRKLDEKDDELNYYTPSNVISSSPIRKRTSDARHIDMPILDDISFDKTPKQEYSNYFVEVDNELGKEKCDTNSLPKTNNTLKAEHIESLKDCRALSIDNPPHIENNANFYLHSHDITDSFITDGISMRSLNNGEELNIAKDFKTPVKSILSPFAQELEQFMNIRKAEERNQEISNTVNENCTSELDLYIIEAELKRKLKQNKFDCTIDRNLEMALQNKDNTEILLDQIIFTPRGFSGASTPTIRNILFGTPKGNIPDNQLKNEEESLDIEQFLKIQPIIQSKGKDITLMKQLVKEEIDLDKSDSVSDITDSVKSMDSVNKENVNQDWYLNVSNLLKREQNEVDLQFSTDLLEYDKSDDTFKKPAPPDSLYDLDSFTCLKCPKTFESVKALKVHFTKYHNIKISTPKVKPVYKKICEECGRVFNCPSNFYKHTLKVHKRKDSKYKCDICAQWFPTHNGLQKHKYWHRTTENKDVEKVSKEKTYVCFKCGKDMRGKGNLEVHLRRHTKDYSMFCDLCGKGFYLKHDLSLHMRTHTGVYTLYDCEICHRQFTKRSQLSKHTKTHINKEKYTCETCKIDFTKKILIERHLFTGVCLNNIRRPIKFRSKKYMVLPK